MPHARVALALLALFTAAGCYSEKVFIEELPPAYCEALFTCYDNLEADCTEVLCLYEDEAACTDTVTSWYADGAGACADGERFVSGEGRSCLDDLARFDCVELTAGKLPPSCSRACD